MKRESKNLILGIIIVIVIIILYFIFNTYSSNKNINQENKKDLIKKIELSKSNFVYVGNGNINSGLANKYCNEYKARNCRAIADEFNIPYGEVNEECWKHFWNFEYKLINMPQEVLPYYNDVKCKAYQNGEILKTKITDAEGKVFYEGWRDFGSPEGSETQAITFWVDVTKDSDIMLCCQINDTGVAEYDFFDGTKGIDVKKGDIYGILSNEVCLDKIKINSCQSK